MPIKSCIVATGGGIVLRTENWSMMSHAIVVWLHGETALLARRLVADGRESRPLLADEDEVRGGHAAHAAYNSLTSSELWSQCLIRPRPVAGMAAQGCPSALCLLM